MQYESQRTGGFYVHIEDGTYVIEIFPWIETYIHAVIPGSLYQSNNDDVFRLTAEPGLATFTYSGTLKFEVWTYGPISNVKKIVEQIGPGIGDVHIDQDVTYLEVRTTGPWSVLFHEKE